MHALLQPIETLFVVDAMTRPGRGEHRARLQGRAASDRH
jgi:hypothetical protein